MKSRVVFGTIVAVAAASATALAQRSGQIYLTMQKPDQVRYRLMAEEDLSQPDGRMFVPGVKIWNVLDRSTGSCYMMVFTQSGSMMAPVPCNSTEQNLIKMLDPNGAP